MPTRLSRPFVRVIKLTTEQGEPISVRIGPDGIAFKIGRAKWSSSAALDWESMFILAGLGVKASTDPNMTK